MVGAPKGFTQQGLNSQSGTRFHRMGLNGRSARRFHRMGLNSRSAKRFHTSADTNKAIETFWLKRPAAETNTSREHRSSGDQFRRPSISTDRLQRPVLETTRAPEHNPLDTTLQLHNAQKPILPKNTICAQTQYITISHPNATRSDLPSHLSLH